jgi:TonB-dependent receptor
MILRRVLLLSIVAIFSSFGAFAQKGTIRGIVIEDKSGEPLIGVSVVIQGTSIGAPTDLDGAFSFQAEPGTYEVNASFISFETKVIKEVVVKAGEVTVLGTIRLGESVEQLSEVVVRAELIRETETALLTVKRKSSNIIDGISAETFQKIGDSDAASAIKRVPGVSIQDGQYVFVRGLGDRYTKTTLGQMNIPGLDPDRNAVQMDIFPTNLINNIIVYKSFTPELSADFVGGTVDIELKDFPDRKVSNFSISATYNPSMHFQSNFLDYNGGSLDFLGLDDGTRDLPFDARRNGQELGTANTTTQQGINQLSDITRKFDKNLAAQKQINNLPDISAAYSRGNQFDLGGYKLGYNLALNYNKSTTFYEEAVDAYYQKPQSNSETELLVDTRYNGALANTEVKLSGLAGLALKTRNSKYALNYLRIQNGISRAGDRVVVRSLGNFNTAVLDNLEYTERQLNNLILDGRHSFGNGSSDLSWKLSGTISSVNDKDVRITPFTVDEGTDELVIRSQEGGEPQRIWRLLDEQNYGARIDYVKNFKLYGLEAKFKVGALQDYKTRNFELQDYSLRFFGSQNGLDLDGNPDNLLLPENIIGQVEGVDDDNFGTYYNSRFSESNAFEGAISILGTYVSGELTFTDQLKGIFGVRMEKYDQFFTGQNQSGSRVFDNENVLNSTKFFPSLNLTYSPLETTNLRASYSRTVARPSFKEKSTIEIPDVLTGLTYIGNIDLVETDISNFDLRYEMFFKKGQTVSLGAFYKTFTNPIELVRSDARPDNVTPKNVGDAQMIGAELEVRKDLSFISPRLENFSIKGNFTFTEAFVKIDSTEAEGRKNGLREGEEFSDRRDFVGQPPYIINAGFDYLDFETGWEGSLAYNVQAATLAVVGVNRTADTYTVPFNSLNFNLSKSFGTDQKNKLGVRINNILGDIQEREFVSFGAENQIEYSRDPGTSFRVQYSRTF